MKKSSVYFLGIVAWGMLFSCPAYSQDIPEWLKRVEFSAQYETDSHPTFYFQTVQPFYQSEDKSKTFFYQPRISLKAGDLTYNFGVGYRKIIQDELLLGVNLFGDYQDLHQHGRVGVGFESLGQVFEARLNGYFRVTPTRVVEETDTSITYERVANGADFEVGAPVPYVPWLKLYTSGFWYNFTRFDDKCGWKLRLEAKLKGLRLEFYTWDDNKGEQEYGGRVRFTIAFDKLSDFKEAFKFSDEPFPKRDLTEQTLIPVERNYDIVVEKWSESKTGNVTVEIGRAN